MESQTTENSGWLDTPLGSFLPKLTIESGLVVLILIAAIVSRFYQVDARVMSHDEVNHVVPSYSLYRGQGYAYDPVTHGPMQFHLLALSYYILGDSDFSARVPAVLFSIATVGMALIGFRRYLGRSGAILAGILMLISPYMLFYGRYTRNEAFGGLWTVLMLYGALRYLDKGDKRSLYLLTVVMALHFTDKATAYIYNAQLMLFMGFVFLFEVLRLNWPRAGARNRFLFSMVGAVGLLAAALGVAVITAGDATVAAGVDAGASMPTGMSLARVAEIALVVGAAIFILYAIVLLVRNLGWTAIRKQRSFDLIMLAGSLTLPLLAAFPVRMLGWDPLDYTTTGMLRTGIFLVICTLFGAALGMWWKPRFWLGAAAIFFAIFTVFFTTFFTNGKGFFMGLIASLGYWLSQQSVERGSQPLYYYALVQIPMYEYLPALGALLAFLIGLRRRLFTQVAGFAPAQQPEPLINDEVDFVVTPLEEQALLEELDDAIDEDGTLHGEEPVGPLHLPGWLRATMDNGEEAVKEESPHRIPVLALLLFWSLTSLVAYSLAGEKMPWLTVHITAAMILAAGWGLGYLVDRVAWKDVAQKRGWLALFLLPVFIAAAAGLISTLLGSPAPFSGNTLEALNATSNFLLGLVGTVASAIGLMFLLSGWFAKDVIRLIALAGFAFLGVLTAHAAFMASYVRYDEATEFLVYAHAARGPKDILAQVEEISKRTVGDKNIVVAYDNESNYPNWWYLRDYPNKKYFADTPGRDVREAPVIIVGDPNFGKIEPIVKDNYISIEYMRLWWPMQDYFNLTWDRIWNAVKDPTMRQALINIWLNRDYSLYAQATGSKSLTLDTWSPAAKERLYIRKDVVAQMWNYGAAPSSVAAGTGDPYEKAMIKLAYDRVIGSVGANPGQLNAPRGVAVAKDGSVYVADSRNHRVQHLSADGQVLQSWGSFSDVSKGQAPGGTFYEPWGVAVGPDGSVYVTDTWNHRVQKFSAEGQFLTMWGYFGQAEKPEAFWGPRGIAVDAKGQVYVVDTGNKRIAIFGANGEAVTSFGKAGFDLGQFDEPVGIALSSSGLVFVTDTWNQRIQVFQADAGGVSFMPLRQWEVSAWYGQSLDNKPFIVVDKNNYVYTTDPDSGRVLQFDANGQFLRGWSDLIGDLPALGMPAGLAVDGQGGLWVSDASLGHLYHFNLPAAPLPAQVQPPANQPQIGPQDNITLPTATLP